MTPVIQKIPSRRAEKVRFDFNGRAVSFAQFFHLLASSTHARFILVNLLKSCSFTAVALEMPCLHSSNMNAPAELVLVAYPALEGFPPDPHTFAEHFDGGTEACVFENLSGDSLMVAPTPNGDRNYSHLMKFIRSAPDEQLDAFWELAAKAVVYRVESRPQWVSTAGLGVHWLHLRICDMPKYYRYEPYV